MTLDDLRASLQQTEPPAHLGPLLTSLWFDAKGDWDRAHQIADDIGNLADPARGKDAAWVHAYLHRKEEDTGNAGYWYRLAGRPHSQASFDAEWSEIAVYLLRD